MPNTPALWTLLGLRIISAMVLRRWPRLARYEALAALCTVARLVAMSWPDSPSLVAFDLVLLVLPTSLLVLACEGGLALALSTLAIPPLVVLMSADSADARRTFAIFAVALVQALAVAHAIGLDFRGPVRSWERRAAAVLAATGVLSMFFVRDWSNVVVAGCVAHAFVLLMYLRHRPREDRGNLDGIAGAPVDQCAPAAEGPPRAEAVEQTEERP